MWLGDIVQPLPNVSRPGKPTDNSFTMSFAGKFRTECLNEPGVFCGK